MLRVRPPLGERTWAPTFLLPGCAPRCDVALSAHDAIPYRRPVHEVRTLLRRHFVRRRRTRRSGGNHSAREHGDGCRGRRPEDRPVVPTLHSAARHTLRRLRPSSEMLSHVSMPSPAERAARCGHGRASAGGDRGCPRPGPAREGDPPATRRPSSKPADPGALCGSTRRGRHFELQDDPSARQARGRHACSREVDPEHVPRERAAAGMTGAAGAAVAPPVPVGSLFASAGLRPSPASPRRPLALARSSRTRGPRRKRRRILRTRVRDSDRSHASHAQRIEERS